MTEHRTTADLREYLDAIDLCYFDGHLEEKLGLEIRWMRCRDPQANPKTVGLYRDHNKTIEIARHLADVSIPRFYVMYIVYHEACHAVYGMEHNRTFQLAEKQFLFSYEVAQWLEEDTPWPEAPKGLR